VSQALDRFQAEHIATKLKPSTAQEYRWIIEPILRPELGSIHLDNLSAIDIARLSRRATPYHANRTLAVLSKFLNWAEQNHLRSGSNPVRKVEKFREQKRERFLSSEELARLGEVLARVQSDGSESLYVTAALRMLVLTGARLSEILTVQWRDVDFERGMLALADSKTGKKAIHLSPPALQVLAELPRIEGNPFVIVGERKGRHLVNLQKPWRRIRLAAGLPDIRIHDLRHSFASVAASRGGSLPLIGRLLGHTQAQTTARYAHLAADPVRHLNDSTGEALAAAMAGKTAQASEIKRHG
jgi:integrase